MIRKIIKWGIVVPILLVFAVPVVTFAWALEPELQHMSWWECFQDFWEAMAQ